MSVMAEVKNEILVRLNKGPMSAKGLFELSDYALNFKQTSNALKGLMDSDLVSRNKETNQYDLLASVGERVSPLPVLDTSLVTAPKKRDFGVGDDDDDDFPQRNDGSFYDSARNEIKKMDVSIEDAEKKIQALIELSNTRSIARFPYLVDLLVDISNDIKVLSGVEV